MSLRVRCSECGRIIKLEGLDEGLQNHLVLQEICADCLRVGGDEWKCDVRNGEGGEMICSGMLDEVLAYVCDEIEGNAKGSVSFMIKLIKIIK